MTKDVDQVDLILDKNESLHNYQLTPGKILSIHKHNFIIIIDKEFEIFFNKVSKNLDTNHHIIEVAKLPGILLQENTEEHEHDEHDEHHHHNNLLDYHFWLDTDLVKIMAQELVKIFISKFPANAEQYTRNLNNFIDKLDVLDKAIHDKITSTQGKNFIVTHNAYQYFIKKYKLNEPKSISLDHDYNIGARSFVNIQNSIKDNKISCIFEEPQFDSNIISKLKKDSKIKIGKLDAEWGPDGVDVDQVYFLLMDNLANNFVQCLAE